MSHRRDGEDNDWEDEGFGPTPEERLVRRRRFLGILAGGVMAGGLVWVINRMVALMVQRPKVISTEGTARVLQWTRIIEPTSYAVMISCLAVLAALLAQDTLQRRYERVPEPPRNGANITDTPEKASVQTALDDDNADDLTESELADADLTPEELVELVGAEQGSSRRGLGPKINLGGKIALAILVLSAITWAVASAAVAFLYPNPEAFLTFEEPDAAYRTFARMTQISLTARGVGLAMLALLGGSLAFLELTRRLDPAQD